MPAYNGKGNIHADTLKKFNFTIPRLNFVNDTQVRLDYLKQFGMTDDDNTKDRPLPKI